MDTQLKLMRAKRFRERLNKGFTVYANMENNIRHQIIQIGMHSAKTTDGAIIPLISIINFD